MPLGAEYVKPAQGQHLLLFLFAERLGLIDGLMVAFGRVVLAGARGGQVLRVAAKQYVGAPSGHVGRDGHRVQAPCLGDYLGLALVLLGVKDRVGYLVVGEHLGELLRIVDGYGADEHGTAQPV